MDYVIASAIGLGFAGGAFFGYLGARSIYRLLSRRSSHHRFIAGFAAVGFIAASPMAFFRSIVVGGNLGGAWGEFFSASIGLGSIGVPPGLAVGIAAVLSVGLTAGAAIGAFVGYGVTFALRRKLAA